MKAIRLAAVCGLFWAALSAVTSALGAEPGLVVHEWGTFTTLQGDDGRELTGVNVDDEPVPEFVHNLGSWILRPALLTSRHWQYRSKQTPRHHPLVTMRLETPVIYFYPPADMKLPQAVDVHVRFRGGWLTEFYPKAEPVAPGVTDIRDVDQQAFRKLTKDTISSLSWVDLKVGQEGKLPKTDWPVWLAPRKVHAATITARGGESEKYVFYRGVANQRSPLSVSTDLATNQLTVRANFEDVLAAKEKTSIRRLWLVDIRSDGTAAFRTLGPVDATADAARVLTTTSGAFAAADFSSDGLTRLKTEMQAELVAEGLFDDEAKALLTTWDRAYFKSPGLRLFFATPRRWTDHYLPLTISPASHLERVMIGRVELITPEQRKLLEKIAAGPISNSNWIEKIPNSERVAYEAGRSTLSDQGAAVPSDYRQYMALGRFRNALASWYSAKNPKSNMHRFILTYGLEEF